MATTVDVLINVKDGDLQGLDSQLNKVAGSLDKVDKEAKQASKSVDDVAGNGGAIAILDQLTGGLATRFRDAYEATKLFNFSLKGTRTALIATGVGAFLVALGAIVAYWDEISELITGTNRKLQERLDLLEKEISFTDTELGLVEKQLKLAEAQGKNNEELQKQRIRLLEIQQKQKDEQIRILEAQAETLKTSALELSTREKITAAILDSFSAGSGQAFLAEKLKDESLDFLALQERINKLKGEQIDIEIALFNARNTGTRDGTVRDTLTALDPLSAEGVGESPEVIAARNVADQINTIEEDLQARRAGRRQQELLEEQILNDQKLALTQQTLGALIQILGQNSKAGKAAAIAQAIINTYQGVTEVWSSESVLPEPLATAQRLVSTATVLASGLQSVQAIKSTQLPAFASGGGGFGGNVQAPSFNVVGQSPVNQLAETISNQNEPIRAYVVGSDVSTQQSLDRNITETATIG